MRNFLLSTSFLIQLKLQVTQIIYFNTFYIKKNGMNILLVNENCNVNIYNTPELMNNNLFKLN